MDTRKDNQIGDTHSSRHPNWWSDKHASAWNRVKEAFARDWEQTKADFSKTKGHDLNQDVADTVKQAAGTEPIPPGQQPNPKPSEEYKSVEPAARFGHGAALEYEADEEWDATLEGKLKKDWDAMKPGRDWESAKRDVRSGWSWGRHKS